MKRITNRVLISGSIALLLAGGITAGTVYAQNLKEEKEKQVQLEKKQAQENAKQEAQEFLTEAKAALLGAQKNPTNENLKLAQSSLSKVKEDKDKKALSKELAGIKERVQWEKEARQAVAAYQKEATNEKKLKTAQTAVAKLTSKYNKALKEQLNKAIAISKAQADKAKKAEEAKKQAEAQKATAQAKEETQANTTAQETAPSPTVETPAPIAQVDTPTGDTTTGTPVYEGASGGSTPNPTPPPTSGGGSGGGSGTTPPPTDGGGSGGGETTPPPAETFTGWVRNKAGDIVWSQGGFKTLDEAAIAAIRWLNANATGGGWSSGAY